MSRERLERLLALATLEDGASDARINEARNAAFLFLKEVKRLGFRIELVGKDGGAFGEFVKNGAAEVAAEVFSPDVPSKIVARMPGICPLCGSAFPIGATVRKIGFRFVHENCFR